MNTYEILSYPLGMLLAVLAVWAFYKIGFRSRKESFKDLQMYKYWCAEDRQRRRRQIKLGLPED